MQSFHLVKVLDRQWAEKLLDGEMFMKPLSAFGDLETRDAGSSNDFRGDALEGVSHGFSSSKQSTFFSDIVEKDTPPPRQLGQIAECLLQERIYSLHCLEYSDQNYEYLPPDKRMCDFGDSAVVIYDSWEYLRRTCYKMLEEYGDSIWFAAKRVEYNDTLEKLTEYNEFTKRDSYLWQKEFRIALDVSNGHADGVAWEKMTDLCRIMFSNQGGRVNMSDRRKPILLNIGNIRDIATIVSIDDLMTLNMPMHVPRTTPRAITPIEPPRKPIVTAYHPVMGW